MDIQWVKFSRGSWHAARPKDHADSAYCGKNLDNFSEMTTEEPENVCKSCLSSIRRVQAGVEE